MTTEHQRRAARRNGAKGGPKTPEGKRVSSGNSTTHALYRSSAGPVTAGPFAEDPEVYEEFVRSVIRGLRPRDDLERIAGREIAERLLDLERVAAFKTVALSVEPARRRGSKGDDLPSLPTPADAEDAMDRLSRALRLSGTATRQLRSAMLDYEKLQSRRLEADIELTYAGLTDLRLDPGLSEAENAEVQETLWRSLKEAARARDQRREDMEEFGMSEDGEFLEPWAVKVEPDPAPAPERDTAPEGAAVAVDHGGQESNLESGPADGHPHDQESDDEVAQLTLADALVDDSR
ncbi:MAG: hypothetical protein K1X38_17855 [Microthrixaceae bacterium]|nr:hypothetical protein [Microthrixaceae bacterium]